MKTYTTMMMTYKSTTMRFLQYYSLLLVATLPLAAAEDSTSLKNTITAYHRGASDHDRKKGSSGISKEQLQLLVATYSLIPKLKTTFTKLENQGKLNNLGYVLIRKDTEEWVIPNNIGRDDEEVKSDPCTIASSNEDLLGIRDFDPNLHLAQDDVSEQLWSHIISVQNHTLPVHELLVTSLARSFPLKAAWQPSESMEGLFWEAGKQKEYQAYQRQAQYALLVSALPDDLYMAFHMGAFSYQLVARYDRCDPPTLHTILGCCPSPNALIQACPSSFFDLWRKAKIANLSPDEEAKKASLWFWEGLINDPHAAGVVKEMVWENPVLAKDLTIRLCIREAGWRALLPSLLRSFFFFADIGWWKRQAGYNPLSQNLETMLPYIEETHKKTIKHQYFPCTISDKMARHPSPSITTGHTTVAFWGVLLVVVAYPFFKFFGERYQQDDAWEDEDFDDF